jgi:hypothetical protein
MIEDYIETVLHDLGNASNDNEVELVIDRSVQQFPEDDPFSHLVIIYMHVLQHELEKFLKTNAGPAWECNIRHALDYLRKMNLNREKVNY